MGITCGTGKVYSMIDGIQSAVKNASVNGLVAAGEEMYHTALSTKTYQDRTRYLTSTIGYGVYDNGVLVHVGGFDGEGRDEGLRMLQDLASEVGNSPCLLLVAAAPYAEITERRGFIVLDGARIAAPGIVKKGLAL